MSCDEIDFALIRKFYSTLTERFSFPISISGRWENIEVIGV